MSVVYPQVSQVTGFPEKTQNVPPNWPTTPTPNKISLLWKYNYHDMWHKFSPYTTGDGVYGIFPNKQPFIYRYPDEGQEGFFRNLPAILRTVAAVDNVTQDTVDDVVRVSKFLISPNGINYNIKQFALQRLQIFDETRLYNPLTPLLATVQPMTMGLGNRPMRHIEGGILGGLLNSVTSIVGINMQNGFVKPSSTAGDERALSIFASGQGKGMIRGADANNALVALQNRWSVTSGGAGFGFSQALDNLLSSVASSFKSFFGSPQKSPGSYRADESAYDLMAASKIHLRDDKNGRGGMMFYSFYQPWYSNHTMQKIPIVGLKFFPLPQGIVNNTSWPIFLLDTVSNRAAKFTIDGQAVGYDVSQERGMEYSDVVYPSDKGTFTNSDVLINFGAYVQEKNKFETKFTDPQSQKVKDINESLEKVISGINNAGTYKVLTNTYSRLLASGKPETVGYDRLNRNVQTNQSKNERGVGEDYRNSRFSGVRPIDNLFSSRNLRMATTFTSDGMNLLGVLKGEDNGDILIPEDSLPDTYKGKWEKYKPYEDDLIAFFFYDVVNQKYIPFRATVKGISEGNTAFWDELRFIGRADQLYSYNGFSRTLSFTFNVVINSVIELMPTWQKINYMASCVKPSNYTTGDTLFEQLGQHNRFIVPPMFMLTIGDLYKFQPIVVTSINVNIPDDAAWETLNEENSVTGWSYLAGIITSPKLGKNYAQVPREAEIAITCNLLEKERAIVGGSHFGHSPRKDEWERTPKDPFISSVKPYIPPVSSFNKETTVRNNFGAYIKQP